MSNAKNIQVALAMLMEIIQTGNGLVWILIMALVPCWQIRHATAVLTMTAKALNGAEERSGLMERLVYWNNKEKGSALPIAIDDDGDVVDLETICAELARYQDTGLEPDDVRRLQKDWTGLILRLDEMGGMPHLNGLLAAEQDGRLLVLPCKVGDTVYILRGDVHNGYETVKKTHVEKVAGGFTIGMLNRKTMKMYDYYYLTRAE